MVFKTKYIMCCPKKRSFDKLNLKLRLEKRLDQYEGVKFKEIAT